MRYRIVRISDHATQGYGHGGTIEEAILDLFGAETLDSFTDSSGRSLYAALPAPLTVHQEVIHKALTHLKAGRPSEALRTLQESAEADGTADKRLASFADESQEAWNAHLHRAGLGVPMDGYGNMGSWVED